MIPINQIVPFVLHEDRLIAQLAVDCLEHVRWPQPVTSAFLLDPIQQQGRKDLLNWLGKFEPTADVLDYAIDKARRGPVGGHTFWSFRVIESSPDPLLTEPRIELIRKLRFESDWMGKELNRRLELMQQPSEKLRERLLELSEEADRLNLAGSEQHEAHSVRDRLVNRKDSIDWAREQLQPRLGKNGWAEIWMFDVLIESNDRQSLDMVLERLPVLNANENDALTAHLALGLPKISTADDLSKIDAIWPQMKNDTRSYLIEGCGRFRLLEAEPILLRWAKESEEYSFEQTLGASGLCEMLATSDEARDFVEDLTDRRAFDAGLVELETLAIPLGIITGRPFENAPQWRKRVEESEKRAAERRGFFERQMGKKGYQSLMKELVDSMHEPRTRSAEASERVASEPFDPSARIPQLAKAKTVGRNDPCRCGSGKKYKKCCGKEG